eukprot:2440443-Prymnesium_polylepis.1
MEPFNYSETDVIGVKSYREREAAEIARVAEFVGSGWKDVGGLGVAEATERLPGGRYQLRYGEGWKEALHEECAKTHDGLRLTPASPS